MDALGDAFRKRCPGKVGLVLKEEDETSSCPSI